MLRITNLAALRYIKGDNASIPVDVLQSKFKNAFANINSLIFGGRHVRAFITVLDRITVSFMTTASRKCLTICSPQRKDRFL